jgi:DnaJ-domain-containing protein 1
MASNEMSDSETKDAPSAESGPNLMLIGTACVIGAVATNVIGFRYSRWAVGKDLYRAWERYSANIAAAPSRRASSGPSPKHEGTFQGAGSTWRNTGSRFRNFGEDYGPDVNRSRRTSGQEDASQSAANGAQRSSRNTDGQRSSTSSSSKGSESGSRGGTRYGQSFRVDFDPEILEELLRSMPRGQMHRARGFPGIGIDPRILEELLRAAQDSRSTSQGQKSTGAQGSGGFEFWDEVFGSSAGQGFKGFGAQQTGSRGGRESQTGTHSGFGDFGAREQAYSVLGLRNGASSADVKQAYRKEAMRWHPDKYKGKDRELAACRFREVTSAYETLMKPGN